VELPVQINLHSGIQEVKKESIKIYPTLASNQLYIANIENDKNYNIFNCLGRMELKGFASPGRAVDITSLKPGTYFIQFQDDERFLTAKFFKVENN